MKHRKISILIVAAILALVFMACSTVPISGRQELNLIPESSILAMSSQQYADFLKTHPVVRSSAKAELVRRVGQNIQHAVERYLAANGQSSRLNGYRWEYNLVRSKEVNAWCMPGGKVVVYTGILPYTKNEAGLAVVLGHEIAHAVANHGNERMSQELLVNLGGMALSEALAKDSAKTQELAMAAFGAGTQVGLLLPYSRTDETEADELGLSFMAMAGYDPRRAILFWKDMAAFAKGNNGPELLATHPLPEHRIRNIEAFMPKALSYYHP